MRVELGSLEKGIGEVKIFPQYAVPVVLVFMAMCQLEKENDKERNDYIREKKRAFSR